MKEEEIFEKYISAAMNAEEREQLKSLLKNDAEAGARFAQFMEETALYVSVIEELDIKSCAMKIDETTNCGQSATPITRERLRKHNKSVKSKTTMRVLFSLAAMLAITGVLFFKYLKDFKNVGTVDVVSVSLQRGGFDYTWGDKEALLEDDSVTALNDTVINLRDGSQIFMSKGSVCKISNTEKGLLVQQTAGRAEYQVAKQIEGSNFRVMTDKMRTTVIGTRFTVDANTLGSKVRVLEGLVKVDDLVSKSYYVKPGEFAMIEDGTALSRKSAHMSMKLNGLLKNSAGVDFDVEEIEQKKYMLLLYAASWDPASRSFIHSLKEFYSKSTADFEIIFMNDKDGFAKNYEMPWASVKEASFSAAEEVVGHFSSSSFPLNLVLIDQHGNIISRSVKGHDWLGTDTVLDLLEGNSH